jgi:hypothetical protein
VIEQLRPVCGDGGKLLRPWDVVVAVEGAEVVEACVTQEAFRFGRFCSGLMPSLL